MRKGNYAIHDISGMKEGFQLQLSIASNKPQPVAYICANKKYKTTKG
jgi:hypothetical protein